MPALGVTRVGLDTAGGVIVGALQVSCRLDGFPLAVLGAQVASHGSSPHNAATMTATAPWFRIDGLPVVRALDPATCGHVATGAPHLRVGP